MLETAMKRTKEQPSVAGLLLIVTGMLLISMALLMAASSRSTSQAQVKFMIGMGCAAVVCLASGIALSRPKKK